MRLAALVPTITSDLVIALGNCGIRTDTDLLFSPILETYRRLPVGSISLVDLEHLIDHVAKLASAAGISGLELLQRETETRENAIRLSTGNTELDNLFGGFGGCRVLEISGNGQSGKTVLALNIVLRHLSGHPQSCVAWLDATGDFSINRVTEMLDSYGSEAVSTALKRLQVSLTLDIDAAFAALQEIESISGSTKIHCVIIDTITTLLAPLLSAKSAQGHAIMTGFMRQLRLLSQNHSCPVLVLNNSTFSKPGNPMVPNYLNSRKPALGPSFAFMSDSTLWLSKVEDSSINDEPYSIHTAQVLKSKSMQSKTRCTFKISRGKILGHTL